MDKHLQDLLTGLGGNYILPFFWQHGETEPILREEMAKIQASGIGAVCVEARPHPDFGGPLWWRDMDIIMDEARSRGMRVWVLDDAHFPTGFANGLIRDKYPERGKKYLNNKQFEVCGPQQGSSFLISGWLNMFDFLHRDEKLTMDDQLLAVVAIRLGSGDTGEIGRPDGLALDLTAQVRDGMLYWDVPAGTWQVHVLIITRNWGGNMDYINIIDADSVKVQIEAVHEPHYAHYAADFGQTFAGFFSDEPSFGNTRGYNFDEIIGRKKMVLPWCRELADLLSQELGSDFVCRLPALFADAGPQTPQIRHKYMDLVTRLYNKNFVTQLGDWCRAHGIEYIGHIIEDQNVHARLGCGPGHFFRALGGQDMSGIDIISQQVYPRYESSREIQVGFNTDAEFFHFALAKLGSSLGHILPRMKGRTLCEIFGASGWGTGVRNMKWITDHALVRGINYYVPHAFSPKEFPDPDCPPHFYARGHNPQFRQFGDLMRYTNRMCHLLNAGRHIAPAAILYHADAEWSGRAMYCQKPAHELTRNQIDFDFLPADVFALADTYRTSLAGDCLLVNDETYRCLIVPYSQYIPAVVAEFIAKASRSGFLTVFVDDLPEGICDISDPIAAGQLLAGLQDCLVVPLAELAADLRARGLAEITAWPAAPYLRYYHYQRGKTDLFMFFNENPLSTLETIVSIPLAGPVCRYDAFANAIRTLPEAICVNGETRLPLSLSVFESVVIIFDADAAAAAAVKVTAPRLTGELPLDGPWQVSLATALEYPVFTPARQLDQLVDLGLPDYYPNFSGTFRYETTIDLETPPALAWLSLGAVYEAVEVRINGQPAGSRICPPYRLNIAGLLKAGRNTIQIDATNTLIREMPRQGAFSLNVPFDPSGLLGPVVIHF